ncbi:DUF2235 domain-containing protein, partial [Salinibacterium sp.]|uniref:T6SS phospholipase effector Tle1-like catalytic domain-containing protein n=1 Tax=Salinibacterium sp. TaxID=1915057 RepID=UPI00286A9C0C
MANIDPTYVKNQTDPKPGLTDPVQGGEAAETARRAPGQRVLTAKEREQRQMALCATVPEKEEAMCQCTKVLHFSVFFDGTGNNRDQEMAKPLERRALSNIAKLSDAHKDNGDTIRAIYIPGAGTPYPVVGDSGGMLGSSIGKGADTRIKKALELLDEELAKVPTQQRILLINVTVFGFSRGAAQARAFVRDLAAKCVLKDDGYVYKGEPVRVAFAGLFDTVCSAYDNLAGATITANGGHNGWAHDMKLPAMVEQSVHMNAAHELRRRFPLDSTRIDAAYPENTVEIWYPGVHSDVGGGYSPQYQGRQNTISRFSLSQMFDLAFTGGVLFSPIAKLAPEVQDEFNKDDPALRTAFNAYVDAVPMKSGPMEEVQAAHMQLFHRWLRKRVNAKTDLPSSQRLKAAREAAKAAQQAAMSERTALQKSNGSYNEFGPVFSLEDQQTYDAILKREQQSRADAAEAGGALSDLDQENAKYLWDVQDIVWRAKNGGKLTLRERTIKAA